MESGIAKVITEAERDKVEQQGTWIANEVDFNHNLRNASDSEHVILAIADSVGTATMRRKSNGRNNSHFTSKRRMKTVWLR